MDDFDFNISDDFQNSEKPKSSLNLKKYAGPIIKIIILLGILFVLVWFFFLRYAEVSIYITATDTSKSLDSGIIYLNDKTYNLGETFKIVPGDYDIRLSDIDSKKYYLLDSDSVITINKDSGDIDLKAYPLEFKKLSNFVLSLPSEIYENQNIKITLEVNNTNDSPLNVIIKGDKDFNSLSEEFTLNKGPNKKEFYFKNTLKKGATFKGSIYFDSAKGISKLTESVSLKVNAAPILKFKNLKTSYKVNAGQDLELTLEIDNSSNINIENLNLDFENSSSNIDLLKSMVVESTKDLNIISKDIGTAKVIFKIPIDITLKEQYFDIIYRNSYSEARQKITLEIIAPEIITPKLLDFGKITASQTLITKIIPIENKTNYSIKITDFDIDITTAQPKNSISDLKAIFSSVDFLEDIPANGSTSGTANVIIPSTFLSDMVTGNITLKTDYFDIKVPFKLEILELKIALDFENLNDKYTFTYDPVTTMGIPKSNFINLKNTGNIDLSIKNIYVDCSELDITLGIQKPFDLKVGEKQEFLLNQKSIPKSSLPSEKVCNLNITYIDPISKFDKVFSKLVIIA